MLAYFIVVVAVLLISTNAAGIGKAWEVSPVQNSGHSSSLLPWPRLESSAFEVRSISGVGRLAPTESHQETFETERKIEDKKEIPVKDENRETESSTETNTKLRGNRELEDLGTSDVFVPETLSHDPTIEDSFRRSKDVEDVEALPSLWRKFRRHGRTGRNHGRCSEVEDIDVPTSETDAEVVEEKPRIRREVETEMEKIAASKNVREARMNSPESWSKQPISVEFRHRTKLEKAADDEEQSSRSSVRGFQAPHADFVTANRRSFEEGRESRDLPLAASRSFEEIPTYRNTLRDRDLDAPYSRGLFYPDRYRTERDYFVRGLNDPTYPQDRYREVDFDLYGRNRQMPKPKRIIYYATLPEVIRKPVDLRSYPRSYDTLTRSTNTQMIPDGFYKRRVGSMDPARYRYYSYPYGNYENYDQFGKRQNWNERPYVPYSERMEDVRLREQDLDHANMKDASRNEESMLELGHDRKMPDRMKSRDQDKLPWPVQIGTEVSVKENERISGRKIFGQHDDYNRFRNNARIDRERESSGSAENGD